MKPKHLTTEFELRTSPHFKRDLTVPNIMVHVVLALIPVLLASIFYFGLSVLLLVVTTTLACLATESLVSRITKRPSISDFSGMVTGILLGLTLPPGFPLWMAVVGSVVAIVVGKSLFGGIGYNVFNPALVGRAFLQASFPVAITTWNPSLWTERFTQVIPSALTFPLLSPVYDTLTTATPLALQKFEGISTGTIALVTGNIAGSSGEGCAIAIILGGLYLGAKKMLDWRIPVGILLSAFILSSIFYLINAERFPAPWFTIFSGGLLLGAIFMATDMVSSPVIPAAIWLYSCLIGVTVVFIRLFGGLPEGVMYAILLANSMVPLLSTITKTKVYGYSKSVKAKGAGK